MCTATGQAQRPLVERRPYTRRSKAGLACCGGGANQQRRCRLHRGTNFLTKTSQAMDQRPQESVPGPWASGESPAEAGKTQPCSLCPRPRPWSQAPPPPSQILPGHVASWGYRDAPGLALSSGRGKLHHRDPIPPAARLLSWTAFPRGLGRGVEPGDPRHSSSLAAASALGSRSWR